MNTVDVLVGASLVAVLTSLVIVEGASVAHYVAHWVLHYSELCRSAGEGTE